MLIWLGTAQGADRHLEADRILGEPHSFQRKTVKCVGGGVVSRPASAFGDLLQYWTPYARWRQR